jgi:hypothetical protein
MSKRDLTETEICDRYIDLPPMLVPLTMLLQWPFPVRPGAAERSSPLE